MKFRTEYTVKPSDLRLGLDKPVAMAGSCFSEYMGARLRRYMWDAANPTGVLFNPLSIATVLNLLGDKADATHFVRNSVFKSGSMSHSWLADSSFSHNNPDIVCSAISTALAGLDKLLTRGNTLIVTFGTAWCYYLADTDYVVANCHKQPAAMFDRRFVGIDGIVDVWQKTLVEMKRRYPGLQVIFTVSPVRHVRDGLADNFKSKATLRLAVDRLCREFGWCRYFPAYEILTDDLRDYRFYTSDLVHPSEQAVEYIQEKFCETFVSPSEMEILKSGESVYRQLNHRPINPDSAEAEEFRRQSVEMYRAFKELHPYALRLGINV